MGELKRVSKEDFQLVSKRNYAAERRQAQLNLFGELEGLIGQREAGDIPAWQVALCLILCGLPYEETTERSITRRARLADGKWLIVRFTATGERDELDEDGNFVIDEATGKPRKDLIPLPFGADRGPLHFLVNKAILRAKELQRRGEDTSSALFVEWESANEYLNEMRLAPGGKNRRDLRARYERISGCSITVKRIGLGEDSKTTVRPIISDSWLPASVSGNRKNKNEGEKSDQPRGLVLDAKFFSEISQYHVPVPVDLLRSTMGRSQLQDYVLWLYWRAFAAREDTLIPWRSVREQLWQNDATEQRLYAIMRRAITTLRAVWPEFRAEVNPKDHSERGLLVGPPRNGIYMFAADSARKQISVVSPPSKATRK
jgi:hypothetical protein